MLSKQIFFGLLVWRGVVCVYFTAFPNISPKRSEQPLTTKCCSWKVSALATIPNTFTTCAVGSSSRPTHTRARESQADLIASAVETRKNMKKYHFISRAVA
jgi:hypothetical protein